MMTQAASPVARVPFVIKDLGDTKWVDAWIDAIPEDPYAMCPCGCGKKWRFAIKENPELHEQRFRDNFYAKERT